MIVVPQRLFELDAVTTLHRGRSCSFIGKTLEASVRERQSYASMHVLSVVLDGSQRMRSERGSIHLKAGRTGLLRKGIYTVTDLLSEQNSFRAFLLYFDHALLNELLKQHPLASAATTHHDFYELPTSAAFLRYIGNLETLADGLTGTQDVLFRYKALEALALLLAEDASGQLLQWLHSLRNPHPGSLTAVMEQHFDKPLTMEDYAYLCGRSLSTFRRAFKQRYGLGPHQWLVQKRMEKAHELLQGGQQTVASVAHDVGYESVSHFIAAFKKRFGDTPSVVVNS